MNIAALEPTIWAAKLSAPEKLLLLAVHQNTGITSGVCKADNVDLARETGLTKAAVKKNLTGLFEKNYLRVTKTGLIEFPAM